jgi:hypothetical protein
MTNKSMISPEAARKQRAAPKAQERDLGHEAVPDSTQLSPQIDEKRTRLQQPRKDDPSGAPTPDDERSR